MTINNNYQTIEELVDCLENETDKELSSNNATFYVKTCGKIIKMVYPSNEKATLAKDGCRKFIVPETTNYSAIFKYCEIDFKKYLNEEHQKFGINMIQTKDVRLRLIVGYLLSIADYKKQIYYYCTDPKRHFIGAHSMVNPYCLWGLKNDLLMTHSACVGVNGKGVLLVANGGGGKSTLSVSCLMNGLDFVSDDYTMLSGSGKLMGMPIYSNVGLVPDSYNKLKPSYQVHWIHKNNRNKIFMDISNEPNFVDTIEIGALVNTKLTSGKTKIYEIDSKPVVMKLCHTSLQQLMCIGNKEYTLKLIERLKHIKTYQIELGNNTKYNVEFIRNFIEKEINNV